ncbi:uncharacterized protein N7473_003967 [Penicillium subrubescens]|uniref:uncharacterized protein n=1 Tax=Penicillium subrubescens TaxID=1316194 RepID=UPI002544D7D9|nr:uncharacterized protein N7473_003967 [Penicillium subrubescens]KAJ5907051.1 hypothetical protein N7473_003967 [Penicillium subrubescens]
MKFTLLLGAVAALASRVTAFNGEMNASGYYSNGQDIYLTDYTTGESYSGTLPGGFNACVNTKETGTDGSYSFNAHMWRTNDGCHNIDFDGALDAHHGYCCGKLPCAFTA